MDLPTPYTPKLVPSSELDCRIGVIADVQYVGIADAWNYAKTNKRAYHQALNILSASTDVYNYINSAINSPPTDVSNNVSTNPIQKNQPNSSTARVVSPVNPGVMFRDECVTGDDVSHTNIGLCLRTYDTTTDLAQLNSIFYPNGHSLQSALHKLQNPSDPEKEANSKLNRELSNFDQYLLNNFISYANVLERHTENAHKRASKEKTSNSVQNDQPQPQPPPPSLNSSITPNLPLISKILPHLDQYSFSTNKTVDHLVQLGDFIDGQNKTAPESKLVYDPVNTPEVAINNRMKLQLTDRLLSQHPTLASTSQNNLSRFISPAQLTPSTISFTPNDKLSQGHHPVLVKRVHRDMLRLYHLFVLEFLLYSSTQSHFQDIKYIPLVEQLALNIHETQSVEKAAMTTKDPTTEHQPTYPFPIYYYIEQIRNGMVPSSFQSFIRTCFPQFSNSSVSPNTSSLFASLSLEPPSVVTAHGLLSVFNALKDGTVKNVHHLIGNHDITCIPRSLLPYIFTTTGKLDDSLITQHISAFQSQIENLYCDAVIKLANADNHASVDKLVQIVYNSLSTLNEFPENVKKWLEVEELSLNDEINQINTNISTLMNVTKDCQTYKEIFQKAYSIAEQIDIDAFFAHRIAVSHTNDDFSASKALKASLFGSKDDAQTAIMKLPGFPLPTQIDRGTTQSQINSNSVDTISSNKAYFNDINAIIKAKTLAPSSDFFDPYAFTHSYHRPISDRYHLIVLDAYKGTTAGYPGIHEGFQLPFIQYLHKFNKNLKIPTTDHQYTLEQLGNTSRLDWASGLPFSHKRFVPYNGAFMTSQLEWFEALLDPETSPIPQNKRIILASHIALTQQSATGTTVVFDGDDCVNILRRHPNRVALFLSGHDHSGHYVFDPQSSTHFVTIAAPIEASHGDVFDAYTSSLDEFKSQMKTHTDPSVSTSAEDVEMATRHRSSSVTRLEEQRNHERKTNVSYIQGFRQASRDIVYSQDLNLVALNNGVVPYDLEGNLLPLGGQTEQRLYNNQHINATAVFELYENECQIVGFGNVTSRYLKFPPL